MRGLHKRWQSNGVNTHSVNRTDREKLERINLIDRQQLIKYCENGVFIAESMKEAEKVYMEHYEKTTIGEGS